MYMKNTASYTKKNVMIEMINLKYVYLYLIYVFINKCIYHKKKQKYDLLLFILNTLHLHLN